MNKVWVPRPVITVPGSQKEADGALVMSDKDHLPLNLAQGWAQKRKPQFTFHCQREAPLERKRLGSPRKVETGKEDR